MLNVDYRLPYIVNTGDTSSIRKKEMYQWCIDTFGKRNFEIWNWDNEPFYLSHLYFRHEKDLNWFLLKWS
jgi:hypothetical protein